MFVKCLKVCLLLWFVWVILFYVNLPVTFTIQVIIATKYHWIGTFRYIIIAYNTCGGPRGPKCQKQKGIRFLFDASERPIKAAARATNSQFLLSLNFWDSNIRNEAPSSLVFLLNCSSLLCFLLSWSQLFPVWLLLPWQSRWPGDSNWISATVQSGIW